MTEVILIWEVYEEADDVGQDFVHFHCIYLENVHVLNYYYEDDEDADDVGFDFGVVCENGKMTHYLVIILYVPEDYRGHLENSFAPPLGLNYVNVVLYPKYQVFENFVVVAAVDVALANVDARPAVGPSINGGPYEDVGPLSEDVAMPLMRTYLLVEFEVVRRDYWWNYYHPNLY